MKGKEFFSKIAVKNYHNELEEILEKKKISGDAKNLLLSMLYKIEIGFNDYRTIKRMEITKGQFIEEIIETINSKCDKIELVEPNSKKGKILSKYNMTSIVDVKTKSIISFPVEKELLYSIYKLKVNDFKIDNKYYIAKESLNTALRIGDSINNKEILRDFTGWSWEIDYKDIENYNYNLIYQNLRILEGYGFLYTWKNSNIADKDYLGELKKNLVENYGEVATEKLYNLYILIAILLEMTENESRKKFILEEKVKIDDDIELMLDKTKFLNKIIERKRKVNSKIKKIDKILNNIDLMKKELQERNKIEGKKIKNQEELEKILRNERKSNMELLEKYTKLMNPKKYAQNLAELQIKQGILKNIKQEMLNTEFINSQIIELQKIFLKCLKYKIQNTKVKVEILELIYHLRYYRKIPIDGNTKIEDIEELKKLIIELEELLIVKGINLKLLNMISKNGEYTIEIIKSIFNSKIINFEGIELEFKPKYTKLQVIVYDGDIQEKQFEIETTGAAEKVNIKMNKRVKLFN